MNLPKPFSIYYFRDFKNIEDRESKREKQIA
jgi:hypothetical protein